MRVEEGAMGDEITQSITAPLAGDPSHLVINSRCGVVAMHYGLHLLLKTASIQMRRVGEPTRFFRFRDRRSRFRPSPTFW